MADAAHLAKAHREDKSLKVARRQVPSVDFVARTFAVAMAALIEAVNVADRGQRLGDRLVDPSEETGRMQQHDRGSGATPVKIMEPDTVDD